MRQQPLRPLENEQCKSAYASPWEQLSQYNCCKQAIALKTPSPERSAPVFCNVQPVSVVPNAAAWEAVAMGKQRIKPNYRRRVLRLVSVRRRPSGQGCEERTLWLGGHDWKVSTWSGDGHF